MTAQKLTKDSWRTEEPLMSADMTAIGTTINKLIDDVKGLAPEDGITSKDVQDAIEQYDQLLRDANSWLTSQLTSTISRVSSLEDGHINIDANNETIKGLKQGLYLTFVALGLGEMDENGNFTVSSATVATTSQLDALNQLVGALQTTSTNTQSQVGLIASWYEKVLDDNGDPLLDDDGNEIWVPKYDGAKILATINDSGETGADIIADLIHLDGYVKASDIDVQNITAKSLLAKGNSDYPRVVINSTDGIQLLTSASASAININMDGSGSLANGNITWDTNGNVMIRGLLQVGSKVMEMVEGVTGSIISVNRAGNGVSVSITVTNSNNYTVQVSGACSIDSTNNVWSATCVLPTITLLAGLNYTYPITIAQEDIPNYDSSISESDTSVTINAWHYVDA